LMRLRWSFRLIVVVTTLHYNALFAFN